MNEKKVRETIAWLETKRKIHKYGAYTSPIIPKEQIDMIEERYDLAIEALEKQLPKKVENLTGYRDLYGHLIFYKGFCPSCGFVVNSGKNNYCNACGQKLDWKEVKEEVA